MNKCVRLCVFAKRTQGTRFLLFLFYTAKEHASLAGSISYHEINQPDLIRLTISVIFSSLNYNLCSHELFSFRPRPLSSLSLGTDLFMSRESNMTDPDETRYIAP